MSSSDVREIAEILALGYLRYRKRQARKLAKKSAIQAQKNLDDFAHRGKVSGLKNQGPGTEASHA